MERVHGCPEKESIMVEGALEMKHAEKGTRKSAWGGGAESGCVWKNEGWVLCRR